MEVKGIRIQKGLVDLSARATVSFTITYSYTISTSEISRVVPLASAMRSRESTSVMPTFLLSRVRASTDIIFSAKDVESIQILVCVSLSYAYRYIEIIRNRTQYLMSHNTVQYGTVLYVTVMYGTVRWS
jgi:hypothetical protein